MHIKKISIPSTKADDGVTMSPWLANGTMDISFLWKPLQTLAVFEESWLSTADSLTVAYALGSTGYYTPKTASHIAGPNHLRIQRPALQLIIYVS